MWVLLLLTAVLLSFRPAAAFSTPPHSSRILLLARRRRPLHFPLPLRGGGQPPPQRRASNFPGGTNGGFEKKNGMETVILQASSSNNNNTSAMAVLDRPGNDSHEHNHHHNSNNNNNNNNATLMETITDSLLTLENSTSQPQYNWKEFFPRLKQKRHAKWGQNKMKIARWVMTGSAPEADRQPQSQEKILQNLGSVARMLLLLREYRDRFGRAATESFGGPGMQRQVLEDITKDLYSSGTPSWVLETVIARVAEGMTGRESTQVMLLPRRCFIFHNILDQDMDSTTTNKPSLVRQPESSLPSSIRAYTNMFKISPGFDIYTLGVVEQVAVRLASFASNTGSVERLTAASFRVLPSKDELKVVQEQALQQLIQEQEQREQYQDTHRLLEEEDYQQQHASPSTTTSSPLKTEPELAHEILQLASSTYGLFFFLNNPKLQQAAQRASESKTSTPASSASTSTTFGESSGDSGTSTNSNSNINAIHPSTNNANNHDDEDDDQFWIVEDSIRDIFTRLATREAHDSMVQIRRSQTTNPQLYSHTMVSIFRILSAAGACAMWFGGSLHDMMVSGALAVTVAYIGRVQIKAQWAFEERVLTEVVASFVVGVVAGVLCLTWPDKFCFGAIAVASVMDMLQGFKVVYAVIELMSKNIVTGTSRLLEGILFTGLISYSLKFGLDFAFRIMLGASGTLMIMSVEGFCAYLTAVI